MLTQFLVYSIVLLVCCLVWLGIVASLIILWSLV
jgi:hypothetical protein